MGKHGIMVVEGTEWDAIEAAVDELVTEKGKDNADREAEYCEWYDRSAHSVRNDRLVSGITQLTFHTRKRIEEVDELTGEVSRYFRHLAREIAFIESEASSKKEIWLVAEMGTSGAIKEVSGKLGLKVTMRRRVEFSEDFIEFLNTTYPRDRGYHEVFASDMQSIRRKARKKGHSLDEGYLDLSDREPNINEEFRDAAGVTVVPHTTLSTLLPTMKITVFKQGWISMSKPTIDDGVSAFYGAIVYSLKRLLKAFNSFNSL